MALLTEKWPAHTATCSKWRLEAKHGYIRNAEKNQWQPIAAMIHLGAVWCHVAGNHERKQNVTQFVCWGRWCVCAVRHLCYRVTFSQWASIWYVAWWQTNLSNMCACVGGLWKTIRLVAHEKQMTSFVCCCLSNNDPLWLIHSPKGFLEKFDWTEWKADDTDHPQWRIFIFRYLLNPISIATWVLFLCFRPSFFTDIIILYWAI